MPGTLEVNQQELKPEEYGTGFRFHSKRGIAVAYHVNTVWNLSLAEKECTRPLLKITRGDFSTGAAMSLRFALNEFFISAVSGMYSRL